MDIFEQKIMNAVSKKLNDGTVENLIEQYIEKAVSKSLDDLFGYRGSGKEMIEGKLNEVMLPVIENHDFNQYLVKLDSVLTEIVNNTSLADNKKILENFNGLMKEPERKEIKMSDIFQEYCKHVAAHVDTSDLEAECEDGIPYYEHVMAAMEVEHEEKGWFRSRFDNCIVKFTCDEDESLNCQIKLYKESSKDTWNFSGGTDVIDINSLRYISDFEVFLAVLNRGFVKIIMDVESVCDDDIEPDEKPEWDLS